MYMGKSKPIIDSKISRYLENDEFVHVVQVLRNGDW